MRFGSVYSIVAITGLVLGLLPTTTVGWVASSASSAATSASSSSLVGSTPSALAVASSSSTDASREAASAWFPSNQQPSSSMSSLSSTSPTCWSLEQIKAQVLQLGAALDRGQAYNPTSGSYYEETMKVAKTKIETLVDMADPQKLPQSLQDLQGEWELVLSTVRKPTTNNMCIVERHDVRSLIHSSYLFSSPPPPPPIPPILGTSWDLSKFTLFPCHSRKLSICRKQHHGKWRIQGQFVLSIA